MNPFQGPGGNRLLAAWPATERERLRPQLDCIDLRLGEVLCEPGVVQRHVWFPTDAIVSLSYLTDNGAPTEIAVVGNDGFVGAGLLLGGGSTTTRGEVQVAGLAFRASARAVGEAFDRSVAVRGLLLRSMQALMTQVAQTAVCNRSHRLDQRLCRLLLQRLDLLPGGELPMTQELIAHALGVRREGVTEAALELQSAGIICCTRGHIEVLDRTRLAQRSCECHAVVRSECDRLVGAAPHEALPHPKSAHTAAVPGPALHDMSRTPSPACLDHA